MDLKDQSTGFSVVHFLFIIFISVSKNLDLILKIQALPNKRYLYFYKIYSHTFYGKLFC